MNLNVNAPIAIAVLAGGLVCVAAISHCLFLLGRWLGARPAGRRTHRLRLAGISLLFLSFGILAGLVPDRYLDRVTLAAFVTLVTVLPISAGFVAGRSAFESRTRLRMLERTEEWLAEWEREHQSAYPDEGSH
ncbi:MAG TPA: hypothetical protein PLL78_03820 [Fimbriimonadaceae bacterium]|nr:hypothetical protein [Fimbriimonadaceae bacterium]HRJ95788.1 hypothetical protein [Fimbriimonadaceae bacterium]